ncbi:PRD domain-containing protein, partial [Desulfovibrio desulfuricans]|nr:PRD domain-containing protein [Desulfovibrio desulfuricans]
VFVVEKKANESYVEELIKTIPFPYIDTVNKVVALAEALLNYSFKDQLFLTLLDHISFSVKRLRAHEDIENPLLNEIRQFYPK